MVLSNEPGYYEDGAFGIRLESLVYTVKADTPNNFKVRSGWMCVCTVECKGCFVVSVIPWQC